MPFPRLEIEASSKKTSRKTRTFRSRLLSYLTADDLWDLGASSDGAPLRPVWLAVFGTVGAARPFVANLRAGRSARIEGSRPAVRVQIPKSSEHRWVTQSVPGGVVTVAYLPELFHLEPQVPFSEGEVRFVLAPAARWVDEQAELLEGEFGAEAEDAARAALFAAYLDRRTPLPLLRDVRFHLELYRAALEEFWTSVPGGRRCRALNLPRCGLDGALVCRVDLATLGEFLVEQTRRWHRAHPPAEPLRAPVALPSAEETASAPLQLALALEAS